MILIVDRGKIVQIVVAFAANIQALLFGVVTAWTSPTIYLLQSPETPLASGPMTDQEVALMSAILYPSAIVGCLFAGWLANFFGRKWTIFCSALPQLIAFILIFFAHQGIHIMISRCVSGFASGISVVIIPIFVAEISDKNIRGSLGNFMGVAISLGSLLGKFLPNLGGFYLTPIVVCVIMMIICPVMAILPDSPQFLLLRNRPAEAERSLKFYRGLPRSSASTEDIKLEFEELKNSPSLTHQKMSLKLSDFSGGATILCILASFWLSNHPSFTGNRVLVSYTDKLLRMSDTTLDIPMMDISVASLQLIASVISVFLIGRFGSRLVLIASFLISFIAMTIVGAHFHLIELGYKMSAYSWLLFVAFAVSTAVPGSAINSLAFGLAAEIIPPKLRGFLLSIYVILSLVFGFFFINYFFSLENIWGVSGWMWLFASWCLLSLILSFFILPDTRGKTFDDILDMFNRRLPRKWRQKPDGVS
ncbi:hypothetical protein DMENIID0001_046800 [Sergentomyia squamirostris]